MAKLVNEIGEFRFSTGALTQQGHALILFANSNEYMVEFVVEHPDDKEAIFNKAWDQYRKTFGVELSGDKETIFYDFMAHYEVPAFIHKMAGRKREERERGYIH